MQPKIVFLDAETLGDVKNINCFEQLGDFKCYAYTPPEEKIARSKEADIIITNKVTFDKDTLAQLPRLKMIALTATGMNNIDIQEAQRKHIVVKNVANYSTPSVVQMTFTLALSLLHRIPYYDQYIKQKHYSHQHLFTHIAHNFWELQNKTWGIIGLGNIGRGVAALAEAFGCKVIYYSTTGKNNHPHYHRVNLEELLTSSDIISIHAPLNEQTYHLLNEEQLKKIKPSAILINVGRGNIIDEEALAKLLNEDKIYGAALDVFPTEPLPANHPLLSLKNPHKIILTPHIAWASQESRERLIKKVYENIQSFLSSHPL